MSEARRPRRATIRDVAAHVGLSTSTVSAALNGGGVLKDSTRDRVRKAAEELGYRPSRTALAFRLGRTGTIAYSLPVVDDGSFSVLGVEAYMLGARAAAAAAFERGYALTLTPPQLRGDAAWNMIGADGVVLCDPVHNDERLNTLERLRIPVVTIEQDTARPDWPYMVTNNYTANITQLLDHLYAQGARKIAILAPDASWSSTTEMVTGYQAWVDARGMPSLVRRVPTARAHNDAYAETLDLITGDERPDASIASAEQFRVRVFDACRDAGVRVPDDLLVAIGGDSEAASRSEPSVTGIDLKSAQLSELAIKLLLRRIEDEPISEPIVLEGEIQIRQSSQRPTSKTVR